MDDRFNTQEDDIKREMIEANHQIERKLIDKIREGQEPDELKKFRESWLLRLQDIKSLGTEKKGIEKNFISIIIPMFLSFKFAVIDLLYVDAIAVFNGFNVYSSHIGWIFLTIACIVITMEFRRMNRCVNMVGLPWEHWLMRARELRNEFY